MDAFFKAIGITNNRKSILEFSRKSGVSVQTLSFFNENNIIPSGGQLEKILSVSNISYYEFLLRFEKTDRLLLEALGKHSSEIFDIVKKDLRISAIKKNLPSLKYQTTLGRLYEGDCLDLIDNIETESVDLVFADPPFNLKKIYPSGVDDDLKQKNYLSWCMNWIDGCIRILKDGGSIFLWNLPRWNSYFTGYLNDRLTFKHWIAVDIKNGLPIPGRLYPSHYSLLYYCKGNKAKTFKPDRLPMEICPKCHGDLRDYGGYKDKMNKLGVNITDIWYDIPPVRHSKYKRRVTANELSIKILDRIIEMASNEGDLIFDPFGGSGTTYIVSEIKNRKWIGIDIGDTECIINRFKGLDVEKEYLKKIRNNLNTLFTDDVKKKRKTKGLWTDESFKEDKGEAGDDLLFPE